MTALATPSQLKGAEVQQATIRDKVSAAIAVLEVKLRANDSSGLPRSRTAFVKLAGIDPKTLRCSYHARSRQAVDAFLRKYMSQPKDTASRPRRRGTTIFRRYEDLAQKYEALELGKERDNATIRDLTAQLTAMTEKCAALVTKSSVNLDSSSIPMQASANTGGRVKTNAVPVRTRSPELPLSSKYNSTT